LRDHKNCLEKMTRRLQKWIGYLYNIKVVLKIINKSIKNLILYI